LVATGANQCWSWDITKLAGPVKWTYYHRYVIIETYSRYVPGWLPGGPDQEIEVRA
jgi:putative transposase